MEIAQDVAKIIIESYIEHGDPLPFDLKAPKKPSKQEFKIPIAVSL